MNFKKRLLTAIFLLAFFILALFYLPAMFFLSLIGLGLVWVSWEWSQLVAAPRWARLVVVFVQLGLMALLATRLWHISSLIWIASLTWLFALASILRYQLQQRSLFENKSVTMCFGWVAMTLAWASLLKLYLASSHLTLMLFIIVWATDSGAYFAGKLCGRHRLIEKVSPNKTWEGLAGGCVLAIVSGVIANLYLAHVVMSWRFLSVVLLLSLIVVIGDLLASMLKRINNIKDMSQILPGHGGVLDRVDGLLAAAPFFVAFLLH